ncbi:hypothetical protein [Streptomyces sp. NBC_00474]|uniref:hypothetical protein n=1 Tax=unclassified Streptomyces TaxID=2593676 RepID=UPI0022582D2E|nr:hypothetical protein [Streptomyces sp. NBC_00474]MCX5049657.1 hypothetical protein [Streptomyces sp. NBC_00474]
MPGTVLLLAASPAGKGCLVDAASVLPVLAAVPPGVLSGTETANVVELADPLEPQAVLTRLRAAAAAPGPLTVFVAGQLQLDRRQRLPHLALARTTPSTVRYTALPWHWIREELRLRAAGSTTLVLDLHADHETWEWLRANPLDCGRNNAVYGRIAPPPSRRTVAVPTYMKAVATILRSGHRPELAELHQQALARVGVDGYADLVLAAAGVAGAAVPGGFAPGPPYRPERPRPQTPDGLIDGLTDADRRHSGAAGEGDPHSAISVAVRSGRHPDADALAAHHEQAAVQAHGPGSEQALHWAEVRADLAMFAGDPSRSCRTWLGVAVARLSAGQGPDTAAVEAAVDRAHHQWGQVRDATAARELGASLAELRARVPGRRQGALDHVQRQLRQLQTQG